jgi:prepilin-type N-terminal cleavage/methylation domain-containing protein
MLRMNSTAKCRFALPRLPVHWLDAPLVGPLEICRRNLPLPSGLAPRRCSAAPLPLRCRRPLGRLRAFTLLELMMVIAIIGFIAALTLPHVAGFGQANSMSAATRQMLDDVALARQRAMVNRSTVYMVFLPPMFWTNHNYEYPPSGYQGPGGQQVSNLMTHQYSGYALLSLTTVGDQPGQHNPRYVTDWRFLPNGVFFAPFEFTNPVFNITTTNTLTGIINTNFIQPWITNVIVPFPSLYPPNTVMSLPCIGFTAQGSLTTKYTNQYIALARGSIFYPTDTNGVPLSQPPNLAETPPANDVNNPNLIQIDWMTARATLMQNRFQ